MGYEILELTAEQKAIVDANYESKTINEMVPMVFGPEAKPDSRTTEGRSIKAYLANDNRKPLPSDFSPSSTMELSDSQKQQIEQMAPRMPKDGGMLELARIVWGNSSITPLHKEARLVFSHLKEVYPEGINVNEEPVEDTVWTPPPTMSGLVGLVNGFVQQSNNDKTYNLNVIKPNERKCLEQLMMYMRVFRFKYVASQYDKRVDRDLFLSTFIRWTHTKPDLTEIEVDQMISAAEETVNIAQIGRSIQRIDKMHEEIAAGEVKDDNGKKVKLGMAEVELIGSVRTKYDAAKKRLESLMKTLETTRSERLKGVQAKYTSIWDLLEPWMKDDERRNKWIDAGIAEKEEDAAEVERLSGLEDLIAVVSGQTKDEAKR